MAHVLRRSGSSGGGGCCHSSCDYYNPRRSVGLQLSRSLARPNVGRTLRSYNKTRPAVLPTSFIKRAGDERANESIASAAGAAAATDDVAVQ